MAEIVGLTLSLTFITAFVFGVAFGVALCYCLTIMKKSKGSSTFCWKSTTEQVIYETPSDLVTATESTLEASGNIAYGVSQGMRFTFNPAYEHTQV